MILNSDNKKKSIAFFRRIIDLGVGFKNQKRIVNRVVTEEIIERVHSESIPKVGKNVEDVLGEFEKNVLPFCINVSHKGFVGFPYAGNSVASIGADIMKSFLQQNLMNHDWSPIATHIEIALIKWLREIVGYEINVGKPGSIFSAGGLVTAGGTMSNFVALLLAKKNSNEKGDKKRKYVLIPKDISHYSIRRSVELLNCGEILEVEAKGFKYDIEDLKRKLMKFKGEILTVVAFAGDSKTGTIDDFQVINRVVKDSDSGIWLHADACHGFCLKFSTKLKDRLSGIEHFDSISADPHKNLFMPYPLSFLLFRDNKFLEIMADEDLINKEGVFDFGRVTPLLGSRAWDSLKLWFLIKNLGVGGIGKNIEHLNNIAEFAWKMLRKDADFEVVKRPDFNTVLFYYKGNKRLKSPELDNLNFNIYKRIKSEGNYFLHSTKVCFDTKKGEKRQILRFMVGNPNCDTVAVRDMIYYVKKIAKGMESQPLK